MSSDLSTGVTPSLDAAPRPRKSRTPRATADAKTSKPVNLRDVAKMAGVSVATVSMVINDNPRISRATHMKVQRLIDRLGYRPNRLAQSLSSKYTQVLAILLPALRHAFADAYFGELISGVCDRAGKMGYKVILEQAKPEFVKGRQHIEIFERRYVDGILALGCNDRHHFLKDFSDGRYPLVVVDNVFSQWKLDYVVCDYRSGADQVMNYLLQLGHRQIGLINAAPEIRTAREVRDVYQAKLQALGVTPPETLMHDGKFTEEGGAAAAEAILAKHPDVTALFAGNDKMALGALHHLTRQGIRVPQDISVIGFDDLKHASFITPSLTTVHLPLYEVGALACEKLIERVHGNVDKIAETLPTHLVMRESTGLAKTVSATEPASSTN
ncbi:MAG TPA: LacI family DNA-binding transcriptional regulator [Tepidisphaeraceae bacterium]